MLQKSERPCGSDAEPSKEFVNSLQAIDDFYNSCPQTRIQVAKLRQRFHLTEHLALAVAQLAYASARRFA